jgi:hypothetical protein
MRRGHAAAAAKKRQLDQEEGPRPHQAMAEALSALNALAEMGLWPAPRDPAAERAIEEVRRRWARIGKRARKEAQSR